MKIGISRNTDGIDGAAELIRCAAQCGFGGIQFKTNQLRAWHFDASMLDQLGVGARALGRGGVVFHPNSDPATWPEVNDSVMRFVTAAGGEHVCYCFCPQADKGHTYDSIARQLTEAGKLYADRGIGFSFHNHTGSMMGTQEEILRLCDKLDPAVCGLTFDSAHAAACGIVDLDAAIEAMRSHINNVHLKDLNDAGKFCPLGQGKLALGGVVTALQRIDFQHWLIVDEESAGVGCGEACDISMNFIKAHGWSGAANG
ncbi:MAG TPA: sugar phosphate isomerase/epimerase [Tepidisphaeraceae bacterium]|jgi:sugar phosphate isomerase/epimerase|nr:sugar phosphate isomerase/epimerase [Tepidisphaeraceae bacterium]